MDSLDETCRRNRYGRDDADRLRLGHGAMVSQMYRNSASFNAGLRPGDVITSVNGKTIEDASQFRRLVADSKIGTTATLHIVRDGRPADARVPIESSSSTASRRRR